MADFDFEAVAVETAELPAITRNRDSKPNPFMAPVYDSYQTRTGRALTLPKAQVDEAIRLIRRAAEKQGVGVRVVKAWKDGRPMSKEEYDKAGDQKHIRLMFQGQERRNYSERKPKDGEQTETETTPETPDAA